MRLTFPTSLALVTAGALLAVPVNTIGGGAASPEILQSFFNAFNRGTFSLLVAPLTLVPPVTNVIPLGSPGVIQEFQGVNGGPKLALVDPDPAGANRTWQMFSDLYSYFTSIGVGTAGYPTMDTAGCPANATGVCNYQLFSNNHALFVYSTPSRATFAVSDPIYSQWVSNGGINGGLGPAASAAATVTSAGKTSGTQQLFAGGAVFVYPAGSATPNVFAVSGPVYTAFSGAGGAVSLGFPTTAEITLTSGLHRQVFENGRVEWTPGSPATALFPITEIDINGAALGLTLNLGATATLSSYVYDSHGVPVTGRALTWSSTNGSVVTVQGNGDTATVKAVGGGVANIYLTGEGKTSTPLTVHVNATCCAIGEGAPSAVSQAFQNAVSRNHLSVAQPNSTPATRTGNGYTQVLSAADGSGTNYLVAESDKSATAWVVSGRLYATYTAAGGAAGTLGYPASDASVGGTQFFESGVALAGTPVRVIPAPIALKWQQAGAETGPLGTVTADATSFASLSATKGNSQAFAGGTVFGILSGAQTGKAFVSNGLILARYLALTGPAGSLGIPVSDPFLNGAATQQNFETGYIDLQPGATTAVEHFNPRVPGLTIAPATVTPGGRVHLALSGFAFGATLTVSSTGQPDFSVTVPGGQFGWDIVVPASAKAGVVAIQARASGVSDAASGAYTITSLALLQPKLIMVSGDRQTGLPGATLTAPLVAVLQDNNGNPLPGVPVSYSASPGASAQGSSVTDSNGLITASLRLQPSNGVALVSVAAAGKVASFSALASAGSLQGYPAFSQLNAQGGLTAALAGAIRFYQNAGTIPAPNGLASPGTLDAFLLSNSGYTASEAGTAIPNPWVAMAYAGVAGGISVQTGSLDYVRDLLNAGSPAILELTAQVDGLAAGGVAVVAVGINADGSIAISDPNPAYARVSLSDYLNGFTSQGHVIQGTLAAVIRIAPSLSSRTGFVIASQLSAGASAASLAGACGNTVDLFDGAVTTAGKASGVRFIACDGTQAAYQLSLASPKGATIIDLASGPPQQIAAGTGTAFQIVRNTTGLAVTPQTTTISAVVNTAGFGPGLSPGGIFTIFGSGLAGGGNTPPSVTVGTQPATLIAAFPFQLNLLMPLGTGTGTLPLQVTTSIGAATKNVDVAANAPGIFTLGATQDNRTIGAILNQDGTINGPDTPGQRGQYLSIYGTGLGATVAQGTLQRTAAAVVVVINGVRVTPSFAGLTPGIPGLYQVNAQVPAGTAPNLAGTLSVEEAGVSSNSVALAIQ